MYNIIHSSCTENLEVKGEILIFADEKEDFQAFSGFSYEIKFPDNQIGEKSGPLNLKMTPDQKQTVPLILKNLSKKEISLVMKASGARTNSNGLIEYEPNDLPADESLAYDLTDLISLPEEVKIPASEEVTVDLELTMPKVAFDGIVLGGIQIMAKDEGEKPAAKTGQMVVNKFARLFGVTLRMNDQAVKPDLALRQVYPGLQNYVSAIYLDIANVTPTKLKDLTTEVEITHKSNKVISYNSRKNNMEMAPNSLMNYYISLDGERMVAGDYTANVKVYNEMENWEWTEDFTISSDEADKLNKDNVSLVQERKFDWKMVIIGAVIGVIVIIGIYLLITKIGKKSSKQSSNKRKRTR